MSTWHYKTDDRNHGPVSFLELAALVREGKVSEGTQVARAGSMNWGPAWRVPGLFRAAGIVKEGDSPTRPVASRPTAVASDAIQNPKSKSQNPDALAAALSRRRRQGFRSVALSFRLWASIAVGLLTVGFFCHRGLQATTAFPLAPKVMNGEPVNCYFPVIGRCTALEYGLASLDAFVVGAVATWYAAKNWTEK